MSKNIIEHIEWKVRAMKYHATQTLRIGLEIEELLLKLSEEGVLTTHAPDACPRCGEKMTGINKGICSSVSCN